MIGQILRRLILFDRKQAFPNRLRFSPIQLGAILEMPILAA